MQLIELNRNQINSAINGDADQLLVTGKSAVTVGNFDGMHKAHQALIDATINSKNSLGLDNSIIFTFQNHPMVLLGDRDPDLLTSPEERMDLFKESGIDIVVSVEFCDEFAELDYSRFIELFLCKMCGMQHMVGGYDIHMGNDRSGDVETILELGHSLNFTLEVIPAQTNNAGAVISSSAIRRLIDKHGDLKSGNEMLGRPYSVMGKVGYGDGRGESLGYPTANITLLDKLKLLPAPGVYAVKIVFAGETYDGMLNYGSVPTIHEGGLEKPRVEVHLFDFSESLREEIVKIEWYDRVRDEQCFASIDDLKLQLAADEKSIRDYFTTVDES
ncbi:MAG: riboflavin biosynthesis protein RibF [bacterium]|nr:riboflavin biosynthesis protein RibF [bacterium]MCP4799940.1 riboflavin biosynthesis protein RibF [bacterium]